MKSQECVEKGIYSKHLIYHFSSAEICLSIWFCKELTQEEMKLKQQENIQTTSERNENPTFAPINMSSRLSTVQEDCLVAAA